MAENRSVKRFLLISGAMLGCFFGFLVLMLGARVALQRVETGEIVRFTDGKKMERNTTFPFTVAGSNLVAKQLVMYEGPYLETGGDVPVSDITALILCNNGQTEIAQAEVTLTGEEKLSFYVSNIMPGAQVLVLEKDAAPWKNREITGCDGWVREEDRQPLPQQALRIEEVDMGTLSVTNTTPEKLTDIWLFYKNYVPEGDLYVGGITYIETIESLEPGQTVQIKPARYAAGYSRIIKAEEIT